MHLLLGVFKEYGAGNNNSDCNNYDKTGSWAVPATAANNPTSSWVQGVTFRILDKNVIQICTDYFLGHPTYIRVLANNTWSSWSVLNE